MHIVTMQKIDYWLGVPICLGLSTIRKVIAPFFKPPADATTFKKILFIELSEMGSAIIAYSAIRRIKNCHSNSEVFFLIFERNRESVELLNCIPEKNILTIRDHSFGAFILSVLKTIPLLWKLKLDAVIDMELFSRCTAILSFLSNARERVGFFQYTGEGLFRGDFLTKKVTYNPHLHMASNFLALVEATSRPQAEIPLVKLNVAKQLIELPQYPIGPSEAEWALNLLRMQNPAADTFKRKLIVSADPGALPLRGWPLESFAELIERLLENDTELGIVFLGLTRSRETVAQLKGSLPPEKFIDLVGETRSLKELLYVMSICDLLVTNDSGPAHMAALTPIKSIVLFGPETPALYGPLSKNCRSVFAGLACSPCFSAYNHRRSPCTNNLCMQAISVDEVYALADEFLTSGA